MPSNTRIAILQGLPVKNVICLCCKEAVDEKQRQKDKAFCEDCEVHIFGNEPVSNPSPFLKRPLTVREFRKQKRKKEEELFAKMMKRMFNRLF